MNFTIAPVFMRGLCSIVIACAAAVPMQAVAQTWPDKAVRLVVPFPPGGSTDIAARLISAELSKGIGQPVILEYKPGAGTNIGSSYVAKSAPDGYTLLMGTVSMAINSTLYRDLDFDTVRDFVAVANVAQMPLVVVANPALPVKNIRELIAYAKGSGKTLNCGSSGSGSTTHLSCVMLKNQAGIDVLHIPYKGSAPAMIDLMAGRLDIVFDSASVTLQHIAAGRMRPIVTTGPRRTDAFKDIETMKEAGFENFEVVWWTGLVAPRGTPEMAIRKVHTEMMRTLDLPATIKRFDELGITPAKESSEAFGTRIRADAAKWGRLVKESGATVD